MFERRAYKGSRDVAVKERMKVRLYLRAVARSSHENSMRRNDAPSSLASDTSHGRAGAGAHITRYPALGPFSIEEEHKGI